MALDLFRRIGSWRVGDTPAARELERQLRTLEDNVSAMGQRLFALLMPRLKLHGTDRTTPNQIIGPGQFHIFDTSVGGGVDIELVLGKPRPDEAGTLIVLLDFGGGAGALRINTPDSYINDDVIRISTDFMRVVFCDGEGYWT